nr:transposase [Okeania sp. SIO2B9]
MVVWVCTPDWQERLKEWILPHVNTKIFNQVLDDFATEYGLGKNKRVLLVIDQAGWHTSDSLKIPEGLDLIYLPAKSPELQPAERLWPLTNEVVANSSPLSLDELEELLVFRCQQLMKQHDLIQGLTGLLEKSKRYLPLF